MPGGIPKALQNAYRATSYRALVDGGALTLRISVPCPRLVSLMERLGRTTAVFVTAFNPLGERWPDEENEAAHRRLKAALSGLDVVIYEGEGRPDSADWAPEKSLLVLGLSHVQACALGRQFEQNALVWCTLRGIPELVLLR